ncbi:MAG TPA: glycosyltransferase family A protein [Sphingobacteriaceae bacterium]|nr:glycosyltransferase family A protein [Sphingobacteriaceae bacterium]
MQNSFFSVIITTYNRAALLTRALESLISQTEKDWEAILIDDGSTDDTYDQIEPYLNRYPQIQYKRQSNQGTVSAKNAGIASARGKFVTFLDSDDEYSDNHLQSRRLILEENLNVEFLHGGVKVIGNEYVPDRHDHSKKIHLSECVIGGTFFIKKEVALAFEGFKPFLVGTDADLFERISKTKTTILKTELPTYIYHRESNESITHNLLNKSFTE